VLRRDLSEPVRRWAAAIDAGGPRVHILAPRNFGKTTIIGALYPLWEAWRHPGATVLVVTSTDESARHVSYPRLIDLGIELGIVPVWRNFSDGIKLSNGSRILSRSIFALHHGLHVDVLVFDDALSEGDSIRHFRRKIGSFLSLLMPHARWAVIETRRRPSRVLRRAVSNWWFLRTPALESGRAVWPERYSREKLRGDASVMGEARFRSSFLCDPPDDREELASFLRKIVDMLDSADYATNVARDVLGARFVPYGPPGGSPRGPELDAEVEEGLTPYHVAPGGAQDAPEARGGTSGAPTLDEAVDEALARATEGFDDAPKG
jgi:hypothetical protein